MPTYSGSGQYSVFSRLYKSSINGKNVNFRSSDDIWDKFSELVFPIVDNIYAIAFSIATILCVIGAGFAVIRYMVAASNPKQREEEKANLVRSLKVIVLIFALSGIVCLIAALLSGALL